MKIVIEGRDLPGRSFCTPEGDVLSDVHVGLQVGRDPEGLVPGDAASARWELDVRVQQADDGSLDFKGGAVHGKRGERVVYLTWGNLSPDGAFEMFRRAKLMLNRIDPTLVRKAETGRRPLLGVISLTDGRGGPRCARVDPPALQWSLG
jgi:hypothetical protein